MSKQIYNIKKYIYQVVILAKLKNKIERVAWECQEIVILNRVAQEDLADKFTLEKSAIIVTWLSKLRFGDNNINTANEGICPTSSPV